MTLRIVFVVIIFAVLITLVAKGKVKGGERKNPASFVADERVAALLRERKAGQDPSKGTR